MKRKANQANSGYDYTEGAIDPDAVEVAIDSKLLDSRMIRTCLCEHKKVQTLIITTELEPRQLTRLNRTLRINYSIINITIKGVSVSLEKDANDEKNLVSIKNNLQININLAKAFKKEANTLDISMDEHGKNEIIKQYIRESSNLNKLILSVTPKYIEAVASNPSIRTLVFKNHLPKSVIKKNETSKHNKIYLEYLDQCSHVVSMIFPKKGEGSSLKHVLNNRGVIFDVENNKSKSLVQNPAAYERSDNLYIEIIVNALKSTKSLQHVNFSQPTSSYHRLKDLKPKTCSILLKILVTLNNNEEIGLRSLNLAGLQITPEMMDVIIQLISTKPMLTELNLNKCNITDVLCGKLTEGLKRNVPLTKLLLYGNQINNRSLDTLCYSLEANTRITWVDVGGNPFDTTGLSSIKELLKKNHNITTFGLEDSCCTENEVAPFIRNIKAANLALTTLNMSHHTYRNRYTKGGLPVATPYKVRYQSKIDMFLSNNNEKRNQLVHSVRRGKINEVKKLFRKNVSPNCQDEKGDTLLHVAISSEEPNLEVVNCLLENGSFPLIMNNKKETVLDLVDPNTQKVIYDLLQFYLNAKPPSVEPSAKKLKTKKTMNTMFNYLAPKDTNNIDTNTPTHMVRSNAPIVLEEHKTLHNQAYIAALNDDVCTLANIIDKLPNDVRLFNDETLLTVAASKSSKDCVQLLLENGADPKIPNHRKQLPLHSACGSQNIDQMLPTILLLIESALDTVNDADILGLTPLYTLVGGYDENIAVAADDKQRALAVKQLLEYGANPNLTTYDFNINRDQCTILHKAIVRNCYQVTKVLVSSENCNISCQDSDGWTPLHFAVYYGRINTIARLLIQPELKYTLANSAQLTPLQMGRSKIFHPSVAEDQKKSLVIAIDELFEQRARSMLPPVKSDIYWAKKLELQFGQRADKGGPLYLNFEDEHAFLQNSMKHHKDNKGNFIAASFTFIISKDGYPQPISSERIAVKVKVTFEEKRHATSAWEKTKTIERNNNVRYFTKIERSPDALDRILTRFEHAPADAKEEAVDDITQLRQPLTKDGINQMFNLNNVDNSQVYDFEKRFHHSEIALFDYLQEDKTIEKIINVLQANEQFTEGAKVYAVILNVFSRYYMCVNCKIGTLGYQNVSQGEFFNKLKTKLTEINCVLPKFSNLKTITLFSTCIPYNQEKKKADEHYKYTVDLRAYPKNNIILSQDESSMRSVMTTFSSRKRFLW